MIVGVRVLLSAAACLALLGPIFSFAQNPPTETASRIFDAQTESLVSGFLNYLYGAGDGVSGQTYPGQIPKTLVEVRARMVELAEPWRLLGLNPGEIYLDRFNIEKTPFEIYAGQLEKMNQETAANYGKFARQNFKAGASRGPTVKYLNRKLIQKTYDKRLKGLQAEAKSRLLELNQRIESKDPRVEEYRVHWDKANKRVQQLKNAFQSIVDPNKAGEALVEFRFWRSLYANPNQAKFGERFWVKQAQYLGGGMAFMGMSGLFDILTSLYEGKPENVGKAIDRIFSFSGLISMWVFGAAAELPKYVFVDLALERGGPALKRLTPIIEAAINHVPGDSSRRILLSSRTTGAKAGAYLAKKGIGFIAGKGGMVAGSWTSHFVEKILSSKGLTRAAESLREKRAHIFSNSFLEDRRDQLTKKFNSLVPISQRPFARMCGELLIPAVKAHLEAFDCEKAFANQDLKEITVVVTELSQIEVKLNRMNLDFYEGLTEAMESITDMAPGEWESLKVSGGQMIFTAFLAHAIEKPLFGLMNLVKMSNRARAAKQSMRLMQVYAAERAQIATENALLKSATMARLESLVSQSKNMPAIESWVSRYANVAGWTRRLTKSSVSGWPGIFVFLATQKVLVEKVYPDVWYSRHLGEDSAAALDKVTRITRCMLHNNYKKEDGCDFESGIERKPVTTEKELDAAGIPLNPIAFCQVSHGGTNAAPASTNSLAPQDCVRKVALQIALNEYHWVWEKYRQQVIMKSLNERVGHHNEKILEAEKKAQVSEKFFQWFYHCEIKDKSIFSVQQFPEWLNFIGNWYQNRQVNGELFAENILSKCFQLDSFEQSEVPEEEWHADLAYREKLKDQIKLYSIEYFRKVRPFLAKLKIALARETYRQFMSENSTRETLVDALARVIAKSVEIEAKQEGVSIEAKRGKIAIAEFDVQNQRRYVQRFLPQVGAKTLAELDQAVLEKFVQRLAIVDAEEIADVGHYSKQMNELRLGQKKQIQAEIIKEASPLLGPLYYDTVMPNYGESAFDFSYFPYSRLLERLTKSLSKDAPFNIMASLQKEYTMLNNALRYSYTDFWNYNNPKNKDDYFDLQKNNSLAYLEKFGASRASSEECANVFATQALSETPGNKKFDSTANLMQSRWTMAFENFNKQILTAPATAGFTFSKMPDLLSQIIWTFPNEKIGYGGKGAKYENVIAALDLANVLSTPNVAGMPVAPQYPEQLRRLDLVAREVSGALLKIIRQMNNLENEVQGILDFGKDPENKADKACEDLAKMDLGKVQDAVRSGDSSALANWEMMKSQCQISESSKVAKAVVDLNSKSDKSLKEELDELLDAVKVPVEGSTSFKTSGRTVP